MVVIDQPCVSCGISLENGVKRVAMWDLVRAMIQITVASAFLTWHSPNSTSKTVPLKSNSTSDASGTNPQSVDLISFTYNDFRVAFVVILISSIVELVLAVVLHFGSLKKSVELLYFWLIITGMLVPITLFVIKIYEMIVVFAYTEDLRCEAGGKALEEFKKLPYVCHIRTQLYPMPVYGSKSDILYDSVGNNDGMIYLKSKTILMNKESKFFSLVKHKIMRY